MPGALSSVGLLLTTVSLWHSTRGAEALALEQAAARFEVENPGVHVALLAVPFEAFSTRVAAAIPHGHGPDVLVAAHESVGIWADEGLLRPIALDPARFFEPTVRALEYAGRIWGVPLAFKSLALFYNEDLVASPPATLEALAELAARLRAPGRWALVYESGSFYHHVPLLFGFGGTLFVEGPRGEPRLRLATPGAARSLDWVLALHRAGLLPPEANGVLVTRLFNEGRAAMAINGPWFAGEIVPAIRFGVAPLPRVASTGLPLRPLLTVDAALLPRRSREPVWGERLARYLASPEIAVLRATAGRQPVATRAAFDDPRLAADPILAAFLAQMREAEPMPATRQMRTLWEPAAAALRRVLRGEQQPMAALRSAERRFAVLTRPAPPSVSAWPYALGLGILALVLTGVALKRVSLAAIRRSMLAYLHLLPGGVATVLLVFVPFVLGVGLAFFVREPRGLRFVGFSHFASILSAGDYPITDPLSFYRTLVVTVLWTAVNVSFHVVLGVALGLLLWRPLRPLRGLYRALLILPWAIPNYITALVWKGMFHPEFGAINRALGALGLPAVSFMSHFATAFGANAATNVWLGYPFMMVTTLAALQSIPEDVLDAAAVDGASGLSRLRHVILPLLRPALVPAVLLGIVWTFNVFNVVFLVSGGEPDGATEILITQAYRWAFSRNAQTGYAAAYATLIFVALWLYARATRRVLRGAS